MNFYSSFHVLGDLHQIDDALAALQRLEDHEQAKEHAFFCITEKLHESGTEETELEVTLPELLKTERERALYDALMEIINAKQNRLIDYKKQMYARTQELETLKQKFKVLMVN